MNAAATNIEVSCTKKLHWWQLSLRTMCLLMVVVALLSTMVSYKLKEFKREEERIANPEESYEIDDKEFAKNGSKRLGKMWDLKDLLITSSEFSDRDFIPLAKLPKLEYVCIFRFEDFSGAGYQHLQNNSNIQILWQHCSSISLEGYQAIGQLSSLRSLKLSGGLHDTKHQPNLNLGVRYFSQLKNLTELTIRSQDVTDYEIESLPAIPKLKFLELQSEKLTDRCLKHLATLPSIKEIKIIHSQVTPEGAEAFKKIRPDCHLWGWHSDMWLGFHRPPPETKTDASDDPFK